MTARKIMIIRHAEKPDPHANIQGVDEQGQPDPRELSVHGWRRAGALVRLFAPRDGHFADGRIETPSAIYAASPQGRSLRSLHTVTGLAHALGLSVHDQFGTGGDVATLAASAKARDGTVLICWRHESIAAIARELLGQGAAVPDWHEERFDMVWVLNAGRDAWTFEQVPQFVLPGDKPEPVA